MRIANAYEELCFHALAFVPPAGDDDFARASSLWDPRWQATVAALDPSLAAGLSADRPLLEALARKTPGLVTLQGLPRLFDDLRLFRKTGRALLAEIVPAPGIDAAWLAALAAMPPELPEILRAHMLLVAPRFAGVHAGALAPRTQALCDREAHAESVARTTFDLDGVEIVVGAALGERGRGFGRTIYVGAEAAFAGEGGLVSLALYERVVDVATAALDERAAQGAWHAAETAAIDAFGRLVVGTPFEGHGRALLDRFAAFGRDPSVPSALANQVVASLRRG